MRETRQSGSEGGGTELNRFSLPYNPDYSLCVEVSIGFDSINE